MGAVHTPQPVKLIVSILGGDAVLLDAAESRLAEEFGPTDYRSPLLPFDHTQYYAPEFGPELQRRLVAFARLIDPGDLAAIKRRTNEMEQSWAEGGQRRVNLDPGYLELAKLVLATTKNHGHRIYIGQGIYAEVTLRYQDGRFGGWPWSYPDYASATYCELLQEIRRLYVAQLKARHPPP